MPPDKPSSHSFVNIGQPASGSALCQDLARAVLDDYTVKLIDMVERSTAGLSIDDIRAFLAAYKDNDIPADSSAFKIHFQRCVSRREQEVFDPNRRQPFRRALTMRFVDLFPPEAALGDDSAYVSRRMLPGLFLALEKMVGSDPFDTGYTTCRQVIEGAKDGNGIVIWENLYAHPATLNAVDDLLMRLVAHFDNPKKRISWMLNIINNDLADPDDFDFEGDANREWRLDESGLINVLRHLFRNLRHRLKDKAEAHTLTKKYGQKAARQLVALLKALDQRAR